MSRNKMRPLLVPNQVSVEQQAERWRTNSTTRLAEIRDLGDPAYRALGDLISGYLAENYPVDDYPRVLDLGCWLGFLAQRICLLGYDVTAIDPALPVEALRAEGGIRYFPLSAEDYSGQCECTFDIIVCNMVLHSVPKLASMVEAAASMLRVGGVLVATIPNPDSYLQTRPELDTSNMDLRRSHTFEIPFRINGQPEHEALVYYFHRPMTQYLEAGLCNGLFLIDEFVPERIGGGRMRDIKFLTFSKDRRYSF